VSQTVRMSTHPPTDSGQRAHTDAAMAEVDGAETLQQPTAAVDGAERLGETCYKCHQRGTRDKPVMRCLTLAGYAACVEARTQSYLTADEKKSLDNRIQAALNEEGACPHFFHQSCCLSQRSAQRDELQGG
jgi:hypothetical protein